MLGDGYPDGGRFRLSLAQLARRALRAGARGRIATSSSPRRPCSMTISTAMPSSRPAARSASAAPRPRATRFEIREWLTRGKVGVVQPQYRPRRRPDRNPPHRRSLRAAWAPKWCRMAGRPASPRRSGRHFHAACAPSPVFEYVSPKVFDLAAAPRAGLARARGEGRLYGSADRPGLGIDLNEDLVKRLRTDR